MSIREKLQELALAFATDVVVAVHSSLLTEVSEIAEGGMGNTRLGSQHARTGPVLRAAETAPTKAKRHLIERTKSGRLARRSAEQILTVIVEVTELLRGHPEGLRSEQIRKQLDLDAREIPRVLKEGITSRQIRILGGEKRATTYGVGGGKAAAKPAKRPVGKKKSEKRPAGKKRTKAKPKARTPKPKKVARKAPPKVKAHKSRPAPEALPAAPPSAAA